MRWGTSSRLQDRLRESEDWEEKGVLSISLPTSAGRIAIKFLCSGRERKQICLAPGEAWVSLQRRSTERLIAEQVAGGNCEITHGS